jgi:hypothetical protein
LLQRHTLFRQANARAPFAGRDADSAFSHAAAQEAGVNQLNNTVLAFGGVNAQGAEVATLQRFNLSALPRLLHW